MKKNEKYFNLLQSFIYYEINCIKFESHFKMSDISNQKIISNLLIVKIIIVTLICIIFIKGKKSYNRYIQNNTKNIPKISVFIPIYNKEKYIKRCIQSIQSQTLKDIEILAVNDLSSDNSLDILRELAKEDRRIKIINNKENRGLLYSRAMGVLNSTGEYLMNLDPDDELEGKDNLEYLYQKTKHSQIDVISFGTYFKGLNRVMLKCKNLHYVQNQPELFFSAFNSSNRLNDYLIWNKLIRRDVYLKAYEIFKDKIYGDKWNYHEDNIWSILVHKIANSLRCLKKIIYIYNEFPDSLMKNRFNLIDLNNLIFRHEMYVKIFNSQDESKYLSTEIIVFFFYIIKMNVLVELIMKNEKVKIKIKNILIDFLQRYPCSELNTNRIKEFLDAIN